MNKGITLTSADDAGVEYEDLSQKPLSATAVDIQPAPVKVEFNSAATDGEIKGLDLDASPEVNKADGKEPEDKEENPMLVDTVSIDFEESKPAILDESKGREILLDKLNIFSYPLAVTAEIREKTGKPLGEADANLTALYSPRLMFSDRLERPGSKWVQHINHGGSLIGVQSPRFGVAGNIVAGPTALDMLKKVSGIGTSITIPLYHSGIWVTMQAPVEAELVNFDFKLTMEKTQVGLSTTGQLLNARSAVFSGALIDFVLDHVTATNVSNLADGMTNSLRSRIDTLDYSTLVWGILVTMYPNGYPWIFECVNSECGHRRDAVLSLPRINWVDKTALTEKQIDMLVKHRKAISDAEIADYKAEFKLTDKSVVALETGVRIHLKRATLDQYIESATKWVDVIERQHTTALSNYSTEAERESYLRSQIQSRYMRKYEHFVEKIELPDGLEIVDRPTIAQSLEVLSSTNDDFTVFEKGVLDYIEANSIAVIGYPAVDCPVCRKVPETPEGRLRTIVPISVDKVFFTLTRLRTQAMAQLALIQ